MSNFYRIAVIGGPGVGKTSLIKRLINNSFEESPYPSDPLDPPIASSERTVPRVYTKVFEDNLGTIRLGFIEYPSDYDFTSMNKDEHKIDAIMALSLVNNVYSQQVVLFMLNSIYRKYGRIITGYCGTKCDLLDSDLSEKELIDPNDFKYSETIEVENGGFKPISSKTNHGVLEVLTGIVKSLEGNYDLELY